MRGHIKGITQPRVAGIGDNPLDVLVLKDFAISVLTAANDLLARKNSTDT